MTSKNQKNLIDATEAVTKLQCLYNQSISNLQKAFKSTMSGHRPDNKIQEYYPQITIKIDSFSEVDSRLAFGHVNNPGTYTTTITRPNLFKKYLIQQISLLIKNLSLKASKFQSGFIYQYAFMILIGLSALLTFLILY